MIPQAVMDWCMPPETDEEDFLDMSSDLDSKNRHLETFRSTPQSRITNWSEDEEETITIKMPNEIHNPSMSDGINDDDEIVSLLNYYNKINE